MSEVTGVAGQILHGETTIKLSKETMVSLVENFLNANMPSLMVGCRVADVSVSGGYGDRTTEITISPIVGDGPKA